MLSPHRRPARGFTLLELMVVVGIVALLLGIGAYTLGQARRRVSLERASFDLAGQIQRAQALAAVAGSRLGVVPGAQRFAYGATCTPDPEQQLWIRVQAGNRVELPTQLTYNNATDVITVDCVVFDIGALANGTLNSPLAGTVFAFTPSGHLIAQAGAVPVPVFFQVSDTEGDSKTHGFRVLNSGIICPSSNAGAGPPFCDEAP